jgi:UDP-glucuronate 4-epimerase
MNSILISGGAGFIGFHIAKTLLAAGKSVVIIDNLNHYYEIGLKKARLEELKKVDNNNKLKFFKVSLENYDALKIIFDENKITKVCNLAAQAGVRYSIQNPFSFMQSNGVGFLNILELSKEYEVDNFVYASSSSVYGNNDKVPFSEDDPVTTPISLYAATKRSNELVAHVYSKLYGVPCTGLRLFTVYGPWGRPDMAYFKFVKSILNDAPIEVYGEGKLQRDFTYIDDITNGIITSLEKPMSYEIINLGNHHTVELSYFIECIESILGKKAGKIMKPKPPGDVIKTWADINKAETLLGYTPKVNIEEGLKRFIDWYKEYIIK